MSAHVDQTLEDLVVGRCDAFGLVRAEQVLEVFVDLTAINQTCIVKLYWAACT